MVASRKMWKPPYCPLFEYTPVVCEYWPVRMLARLGQQSGLTTKAFLKSTPWSTRSDWTFGISRDRVVALVVGEDEDDAGLLPERGRSQREGSQERECADETPSAHRGRG